MLKGVRVLAVEQYGAGPFGTQFLADMGAEVIKIENPADGGDVARTVGPHWHRDLPETAQSVFFQGLNRAKKSLTLNLNQPEGRAVFLKLVAGADAVTSNLRGDVPAKLGLTYAQLAEVNPRIVCGHLTGYGREGERARWPGYDFLMQAEAGYFELTGEPGSAPARCGLSLIDLMTGSVMSMAVVAAIMQARAGGVGRDVDVSLFDLSLSNLNYIGHWYLNGGEVIGRLPRSAHASLTPCQTYKTRDGWIYLMCNKEKFWGALCRKIGRPEWIADPRFVTFKERFTNRPLITQILDEALSAHTTDEWMEIFAGAVPAAPIYDVKQALENPWVKDSDRIAHIPVEGGADLHLLDSPIRYAGRPETARAPALGEHTDALLAEAGYSGAEIERMRALGTI
ncbi:MAG TPA: CoA transferase [Burkholderiales bacterium]|jgi:crotonobetainyl-CoA:carnitine CoA-transferase CaiB-like acyl-CoA transferase